MTTSLLCDPPFRFQEIHLELTTACNFRCGFCPLSDLQRPAGRLEFETAERVLRECIDRKLASGWVRGAGEESGQ
jgi:molybdenum cofactor biosynthesis enzyme MoaA